LKYLFYLDHSRAGSQDLSSQYNLSSYNEGDYRQQVVAVGTPLPTASLPIGMYHSYCCHDVGTLWFVFIRKCV